MPAKKGSLPATPRDFKFHNVPPTQALKDLWKHTASHKLGCQECGEVFERLYIFEQNFEPIIEDEESLHLLYQIEDWTELFFVECPNCGKHVQLKGGRSHTARRKYWD